MSHSLLLTIAVANLTILSLSSLLSLAEVLGCHLPEVVTSTQEQVGLSEEGGANLSQSAVATGTFQTVLVPELVEGLQQVPLSDGLFAC